MEFQKNPKVTVLMPVYNGQKYLRKAIESISNQTFKDFEFLIINDGSVDKSEDIIKEYQKKDSRIIYNKNEKNLGLIKTLNSGLVMARGEYIIRMDADDVSDLNRIEKQVQFLNKNSTIGVLGSWFDFINDSLEVKWPTDDEDIKVQLFCRTAIGHPTVAIRRSVLINNNITYDVNFPHAEDYNLWVDLLNYTMFANYPEKLFHYRAHKDQVSVIHRDRQSETVDKTRLKALGYLVDNFTDKEAELHLALLDNKLAEVDFGEAKKWLNALININNQKRVFDKDKFDLFVKNILNKLKEPLVSIIIPAYNSEEFISETLDCLINQNYKKWEAIIVDDGSTDNTVEIIKGYAKRDNRFRYIKQENFGTSVARNTGLKISKGEYIQFLDSDDFISKDKISEEILIFNQDLEAEIVYGDYICFANENREKKWIYSRVILNKKNPLWDFAKNWGGELCIPIHCFLYKKYCLESINGFDESLTINHEDWDLHLRLAANKYNFKHHQQQGAFYRVCLTRNSRARNGPMTLKGKRMMLKKFIFNYDFPITIKILFAFRYYEDLCLIRKINTIVFKLKNFKITPLIKKLIHVLFGPKLLSEVIKDKFKNINFLKNKHIPFVGLFLLIFPSLIWIFFDNSVWPWDQAWYGEISVNLYYKLFHSFSEWPKAMLSAFRVKAPAIAWLGQFFVPLAKITGSMDKALMLSVVLAQFFSLLLMHKIVLSLTNKKVLAILGSLIMASSSLFIAMGHQYLVESLQLLVITLFIFILVNAKKWNKYKITLSLIFALPFAMIVKITSPIYAIIPVGLIIWYLFKIPAEITIKEYFKEKKNIIYYIFGLLFMFCVIGWYIVNWEAVFKFMRLVSSGSVAELYGIRAPFFQKFNFWISSFQKSFFIPSAMYFIFFIFGAFLFQYIFLKKHRLLELPILISIFSIALVLIFFSFQINEETRYLLPLLPYFVILMCWLLYKINSKWINIMAVTVFGFQFIFVNGFTLGLIKGSSKDISSWAIPVHVNSDQKKEMEEVITQTCKLESINKFNIVGVEFPWLNANSVEYYATQQKIRNDFQCYYTSLGYAESNADKAINNIKEFIKPPYFITVSKDSFPATDAFNTVSAPVAESIENDKKFVEQEFSQSKLIRIFRNVTEEK